MADLIVNGELMLYGFVGDDWEGFTAMSVVKSLATMRGKPVTVRINSGGGFVTDGVAIYNALKGHDGEVTIYVDAMAASAASVIAMGGSKIIMRKGSMMMIHDPLVLTVGNKKDHEKSLEMLEVTADAIAAIYAERTGRSIDDIRSEMEEEIWLTPTMAISKGYADEEDGEAIEASAFDYRIYAKAPEPMKALAAAKGWAIRPRSTAAHAAQIKETTMTQNTSGSAAPVTVDAAAIEAAAVARVTAIVEMCNTAGEPAMAASLIREGITAEEARSRVEGAREIRAAVNRASKLNSAVDARMADNYIASGASVQKVRADLFERMANSQESRQTNGYQPMEGTMPSGNGAAADLNPYSIYASRQKGRVDRGRARGLVA
jgi:ATP-dependent Clp protease protease subunit